MIAVVIAARDRRQEPVGVGRFGQEASGARIQVVELAGPSCREMDGIAPDRYPQSTAAS